MATLAPTIAMLAAFVLAIFGAKLARRGPERTKGVLMLVMAVVLIGNVLIWTW
ncbi:hypothetical protein [Sphingomonas sp.]|jgi:hypothetical protein|uniref:hypothetical protein n=1 Tax=Sphingomonas sp. TaxID=28214 RepID=UPI002D7EF2CA|nr:hypothetical protein [Sphingomonas sp.]HEU0043577.1 hypothetical protein [Sphingomonas sp.]